ncbi:TraB/GumN family protein [Cereibacter sphaeroides]|uniref:TraB/GumN family protein n=1 Tax=Cereibacter sphaeroides TaxID=1063 RepID=UPI000F52C8A1|nr:TraB/GumN family protein [Cereibacter sphaeroides]AZB55879.1 TraB/GumN family protein [Cereibacter sphaeroides]AZB60141.1 TraB/GumN family protein [Cereibacter sphaeroides]
MTRLTSIICAFFLASAPLAHAACTGTDLIAALPQPDRAELEAVAAGQPFSEGNFWQATREGREVTVVGTYHLGDPRQAALLDRLRPRIEQATALLVEAGPEEEARLKEAMAKDPSMLLSDGPTLPEVLSEEEWHTLSDALRARGIPPVLASKFEPWYVSMTLALPPCAVEATQNPNGLDKLAMRAAEAAGVPVRSLEPWNTVFQLFAELTPEEQLAMVRTALPLEDRVEDLAVTLADRYFAGQSRTVWEYMRLQAHGMPGYTPEKADAEFAKMEETLISRRNRDWLPVIEAAAAEGPVVVAVGALHLPGREGVLALLRDAGYAVTPLD